VNTAAAAHPLSARVAVIGAGGLGCAVLPRIARMHIQLLSIIDGDRVEMANLERQPLFEEMDIGHFKAGTAAMWMRQLSPHVRVLGHDTFLDHRNAAELLAGHDIVVDGVDDLHAKALIDRICAALGIPLVTAGVHRDQGQVLVLHTAGAHPELTRAKLFAGSLSGEQDGCDMRQVPLQLLEEVGRRMAARVHDLLHQRPMENGRIELYDHTHRAWTFIAPPQA
jgi:molybdopterin/thiamine biosynthesis adenylyltransferase